MERFYLRIKEICLLSALLAVGAGLAISGFFFQSSWSVLFSDVEGDGVHEIKSVQFISEFPLTDKTMNKALAGDDVGGSFGVEVVTKGEFELATTDFPTQAKEGLLSAGVELPEDLKGKRYGFFVDVDVGGGGVEDWVYRGFVYYFVMWSPYKFFVNGTLFRDVDNRVGWVGGGQVTQKAETYRLLWVVENSRSEKISGLDFRNGLSVRSQRAMGVTYDRLPVREQFPRIAAAIAFFIIGIVAFGFAVAARDYLDIWAFSAFCMCMGLFVWGQTPMFYEGFVGAGRVLASVYSLISTLCIISATVLTLAYFRLDGRHFRVGESFSFFKGASFGDVLHGLSDVLVDPFKVVFFGTVMVCGVVLVSFWPMTYDGHVGYALQHINTKLGYVLVSSQVIAMSLGFRALFGLRGRFVREGLLAQVRMINRRIGVSAIFAACMCVMLAIFAHGFGTISLSVGTDTVLIAAIFPAVAILLLFFWMVSSANRFYEKFAPRLGQIDHEVLAFGEKALSGRYYGSLVVFDLAGMKRLNVIRSGCEGAEGVIDSFISLIEHDLGELIQRGNTTFRYKSNGDEFIFAMRADDEEKARALTSELAGRWIEVGEEYMKRWRNRLQQELSEFIEPQLAAKTADSIDMHVLMTSMLNMKITIKGGIDRPLAAPDFVDERFTRLSALFKPTRWNKIAMHEDDAAGHERTTFHRDDDSDHGMGYLVIDQKFSDIKKTG